MKHLRTTAATLAAVCLATGCGIAAENKKYDYKAPSGTATIKPLEVPPELTPLNLGGVVAPTDMQAAETTPVAILPQATDASIERDGSMRWLLVKQPAEKVWPVVVQFWKDQGFQLSREESAIGIMETDWAQNRGKLPNDFIRRAFGSSLDRMFSTGEKDRYRARLERRADGFTEVFISQQRKVEDFTDSSKSETRWFVKPADPEAEAEMLALLLQQFGVPPAQATAAVQPANNQDPNASTANAQSTSPASADKAKTTDTDGTLQPIILAEGFDRAWRRVGLTLDRGGFTVSDRDRSHGLYFIRYADPDSDRKNGVFGTLFGDKDTRAEDFQLEITEAGGKCNLRVLDKDGKPSQSDTAKRITRLLQEQLK